MGYVEGVALPSQLGDLGSVVSSPLGPGECPGWKCILAYFEGHRMLLFAPICQNIWGKAEVWGWLPYINIQPHLL